MTWDALVIGAGPAGAVTARELARRGRSVLLVDRATFPRAKVCGCCLNGAAIRTLQRLGLGHMLAGAVPLNRVNIAGGSSCATVRLPRGVALSREVFDSRLIEEAVRVGVEFRPGTTVTQGNAPAAGVTVVATGLLGGDTLPEPGSRIGAGVVLPSEAATGFFAAGAIHMATGQGGYVGLVRVEEGRLDIAAAFDAAFVRSEGGPGPAAEAVLRSAGWPIPTGLADAPWRGTPALTRQPARVAGERWFKVGDAAGYVEPFTGEGMAWAVMSAVALAPIAARDWHPGLIRDWEETHRRVVGRRQTVCRVVSRVLRSPRLTGCVVRILRAFPGLSLPVVSGLNRPSPLPRTAPA